MQTEKLVYSEYIHGKEFPTGTIILRLDNGMEIACTDFRFYKGKLKVYVFKPHKKWDVLLLRNNYTRIMYKCYCKGKHQKADYNNYAEFMKHDRKHKKGTGGSHIYNGSITDYECTKYPLHDFHRSKYVQWNN